MNLWRFWLIFLLATSGAPAADAVSSRGGGTVEIKFEFALYFSPQPAADPETELRKLLKDGTRRLRFASDAAGEAIATVESRWVSLASYAPPSAESRRYTGVGVGPESVPLLEKAERVFVVVFSTPRHGAFVTNRAAGLLFADLARSTRGLIWDEETRQLYSEEKWKQDRIDSWQGNLPDMRGHVTMHAYANPELLRIITLGMRKFGLPDLVCTEIPRRHSKAFGNLINALMQRLAEGQKPEAGQLLLDLRELRHEAARAAALEKPGDSARRVARLSLRPTPLEDGDAKNLLWRIDFPEAKLADATERAMWGTEQLFGSTDSVTHVPTGDAEMAAARQRGRAAFFAQEARFRAGLALKEHLLVKAPFTDNDQTEYMWVEVSTWGPRHVEGILSSDPFFVKNVRAGSRVTVALDDIYDYILYKADGTQEGNETGKVLEQRERAK